MPVRNRSPAGLQIENSEDASFQKPIEVAAARLRTGRLYPCCALEPYAQHASPLPVMPKYMGAIQQLAETPDDEVAKHQVTICTIEIKRGVEALRYAVQGQTMPVE